ncbi:MAG: hypothetical protein QM713_16095 [Arachnia sp.]
MLLLISPFFLPVTGCVVDASCLPGGGDRLLTATSAVAERVGVQFEAVYAADCEDGGAKRVELRFIDGPSGIGDLEAVCVEDDWRYRCEVDGLEFYIQSNESGFPEKFEGFEIRLD